MKAEWLLLWFLAMSGCTDSPETGGPRHPISARLVHPKPATASVNLEFGTGDVRPNLDSGMTRRAKALRAATVQRRIGVLAGSELLEFGSVRDAAIDGYGRLAVLDAHAKGLRVFDDQGRPVQVIGTRGEGPGEFIDPIAVDVDRDGHLFVFDRLGRVSVYETGRDSLRFARSMRVRPGIFDGCAMHGRIYLHAMTPGDDRVVQVYASDGEYMGSFGEVYRTENFIVERQIARGWLECSAEAHVVLLAPALLPEVRAYSADGTLLWWTRIAGYTPIELTEIANGSLLRVPAGGYDVAASLVASAGGDDVILQVARVTRKSMREKVGFARLHTVLVSARRGRAVLVADRLPLILAWGPGRMLSYQRDPYPRVTVLAPAALP